MTKAINELSDLTPDPSNANTGTERGRYMVEASLRETGAGRSIVVDAEGRIIAGNKTLEAWADMGGDIEVVKTDGTKLIVVQRDDLDLADVEGKARRLAYLDNRAGEVGLQWDTEQLLADINAGVDLDSMFFEDELAVLLADILPPPEPAEEAVRLTLAERFIVPPFSVLDARQGYWQDRKRAWMAMGLDGEVGRDGALAFASKNATDPVSLRILETSGGTSVFDPVLTECLYRWFCPPGGHVINPTAGESVYGIVAGVLGYSYQGVELRIEQVEANRVQADKIGCSDLAQWIHADGRNTGDLVSPADFIINCPPYHDLEVYSDDPNDISTIDDYEEFMEVYSEIVRSAVGSLKDNRFACAVVGDIRDNKGNYKNFVSDTIGAFVDAGCHLYNEAILITPIGTVMLQVSRNFPIGRKLGKTHQNVLVFVKGDWREAVNACGLVEVFTPDGFGENE